MELVEYLDQETGVEEKERFVVDNEQKANWALRKIKQLQEKQKENAALAASEIRRIAEWERDVNGELQNNINFFTRLLSDYHRQVLEQDPKAKTIKLPYGTLKMRAQQPEYIRDND